MPSGKVCMGLLLALLCPAAPAVGGDWPMWRHDAGRSAASPHGLPDGLRLRWVRQLPPLETAWPDQPKLQVDAVYEPVVLGKRLFVGSSVSDTLTAYDTETGRELWRFHAEGPVRYAPAAWEGRVYFTSDDGYLYCLDAAKGTLRWKVRGGPSDRKVLGNERLISTWPARGAPVIADGTVYFAAGIWPFMGVFLHALDARTGKPIWTNDGDSCIYIKQPHNADSFAGVAPQGALVVAGDRLLVPGGRSVPACFDRGTGKLLYFRLAENGKRGGGSEVFASGKFFFNGGAVYELHGGGFVGLLRGRLVLSAPVLSSADGRTCAAFDLASAAVQEVESIDRKGKKVKARRWVLPELASIKTGITKTALIRAGDRLYAGAEDAVLAIDLPLEKRREPAVVWRAPVRGTVSGLLAADEKLLAVTREGRIYCFGLGRGDPMEHGLPAPPGTVRDGWTRKAREGLQVTGVREGYCIAWGAGSGRLVEELARQSALRVLAVEPDVRKAHVLRDRLGAAGVPCERVTVLNADPQALPLPPYLASLMVAESLPAPGLPLDPELVKKLFHSLRPYGGVACLPLDAEGHRELVRLVAKLSLANARVRRAGRMTLLVREGALPGSANWTHEHADAANTRVSRDRLVRAPLGVLWFGGPSHDGILPRHGHGPQPQVLDGRLFIEGVDLLRCLDVYTGRVLWEAKLPGVGAFYNNLAHQPGANAGGTNYISTPDGIYVAHGSVCLRLDPATGRKTAEFRLPAFGGRETRRWGYLNVAGDYLIGGADPLYNPSLGKQPRKRGGKKDNALSRLAAKAARFQNDNLSSSRHLVVMDRHTGKLLWTITAESGFRHNGVCAGGGRLYCIDRLSGAQLGRLRRRGEVPKTKPRLLALDLKTGKELWKTDEEVFGTWLSYSAERDVLVEAGRLARDTLFDEPRGMRAYRAGTGKVLWHEPKHTGPAMLHGDTILMSGSACDLMSGRPKTRRDPLTGEEVEWTWKRNYGCNTPAASEHLLTFRSGAAGYYDLCNDGGTGNLGGFRSSCTNNLIVANGVLSAPDYTRTCTCNYQNQTSLALVHMPEAEMWTFFATEKVKGPVRRLGLNFGAPGDRRAEDGTLWLEHPVVGGPSPVVPVTVLPAKPASIRRHSSRIEGPGLPWVAASAIKGMRRLAVDLSGGVETGERRFRVRLHFAELEGATPGERVFDVTLQGGTVLKDFDIAREAGGPGRALIKEFRNIKVAGDLVVSFHPAASAKLAPLLSGIEVAEEK